MEDASPAALARQHRLKSIARGFFVLSVLTVLTPVIVGLFGYNTAFPVVLIAPILLVIGLIIQARSDPAYAPTSGKRE